MINLIHSYSLFHRLPNPRKMITLHKIEHRVSIVGIILFLLALIAYLSTPRWSSFPALRSDYNTDTVNLHTFYSNTSSTSNSSVTRIHSHNDYWRQHPLFSAFHLGIYSIEADVWYFDDELYVSHKKLSISPQVTLNSLYLDNLYDILEKSDQDESDNDQMVLLYIDIKHQPIKTYHKIKELICRFDRYLTTFDQTTEQWNMNKLAIILTGDANGLNSLILSESIVNTFIDIPRAASFPPQKQPIALTTSAPLKHILNVKHYPKTLSSAQITTICSAIQDAHSQNLRIRLWDLPQYPIFKRNHYWEVLRSCNVDYLNVDDLEAAVSFLM